MEQQWLASRYIKQATRIKQYGAKHENTYDVVIFLQLLGYEFDNEEFHAYVHGRLPYELLKPDPVLRNLLHSMPQQKIVCSNSTI